MQQHPLWLLIAFQITCVCTCRPSHPSNLIPDGASSLLVSVNDTTHQCLALGVLSDGRLTVTCRFDFSNSGLTYDYFYLDVDRFEGPGAHTLESQSVNFNKLSYDMSVTIGKGSGTEGDALTVTAYRPDRGFMQGTFRFHVQAERDIDDIEEGDVLEMVGAFFAPLLRR